MQQHDGERASAIITAVTRGLNMGIAEGLQVEGEQFAAKASMPGSSAGRRAIPATDAGRNVDASSCKRSKALC